MRKILFSMIVFLAMTTPLMADDVAVYSSLAELVAAGAPTAEGSSVQVTLTKEKIQDITFDATGTTRTGIYLKSDEQLVYLYLSGAPTNWVVDGTVTATVQATWQLVNGLWELILPTGAWSSFTYTAPSYPFTITDKAGYSITTKFTGYNGNNQNTLTLKYNKTYSTDLVFKVNDVETTYNASSGMTISSTASSTKNDKYVVTVYRGETLIAEQTLTYIPVVSLLAFKSLAEGTEAVILFNSGDKVTYVGSTDIFFENSSNAAVMGSGLGLSTTPTAYITISAGSIWGIKKTVSNIVEITPTVETKSKSTITQTTTSVTATTLTPAQAKTATNQLRYAKISSALIIKSGSSYSVGCSSGDIAIYDRYNTKAVSGSITATKFADLTCIVGISSTGAVQLWPLAVDNASTSTSGKSGTVTWTISIDGSMVFSPTTSGSTGTLATTYSSRPWANYVSLVKTVTFESGVSTTSSNPYMFKDMKNLTSVDCTNLTTTSLTNMSGFFSGCTSLKTVDLSTFSTASVTTATDVFGSGSSAAKPTTLKLSKDFGPTATSGTYITLPAMKYVSNADATKFYDLTDAAGTAQSDLYAYNATLDDYGTYTTYDATANMCIKSTLGCATFCAPFAVAVPEGVTAWKATGVEESKTTLEEVQTTIPAGTPVILKGDACEKTFAGLATATTATAGILTGNIGTEKIQIPEGCYVLQCNDGTTGWYKVATGSTLYCGVNRCYMTMPSVEDPGARDFYGMDFGGQTNSIDAINNEHLTMNNGKFIENGRVIIVKNGQKFNLNGQEVK